MKKIVYISGPMSGIENLNKEAFDEVEALLTGKGFEVINPYKLDGGDHSKPWLHYIKRDIDYIALCDVLIVLEGWRDSFGAMIEILVASKLGLQIIYITRKTKLDELFKNDEAEQEFKDENDNEDWFDSQF